jgi:hypothetical protein
MPSTLSMNQISAPLDFGSPEKSQEFFLKLPTTGHCTGQLPQKLIILLRKR